MTRLAVAAALLALAQPAGAQELTRPVRIEADGKPVDAAMGHAAPFLHDIDGDGKRDLLVGQTGEGRLRIHRNVGANDAPRFAAHTFFQAGGAIASVGYSMNVAFGPHVADLDGDGRADMLTGSGWPGTFHLFRGTEGGFEAGVVLTGADGAKLGVGDPAKSGSDADVEGLGAMAFAFDHDADGDLDLVVGNAAGRVILIPNVGTAKRHSFDASRRCALEADGRAIRLSRGAAPAIADWDGDGRADLVVGAYDGSVTWYRNAGAKGAPSYEAGRALLGASEVEYQIALPHRTAPNGPGLRAKVCVADWNLDGLADLLAEVPQLDESEK